MDLYQEFDQYLISVKKNDLNAVKNQHRPEFLHKLDENDLTPFHHACNLGNIEVAKFLISKNVNIEFPCPYNGWRALHWAVGNGYEMVGKVLIEHGADKEAKTSKGLRPLHCAAIANHYNAVRELLAHGVDINAVNDKNETAMKMAQGNECDETVEVFNKWLAYEQIFNIAKQNQLDAFKEAFIKERVLVKEKNTQLTVLDTAVKHKAYNCLEFIFLENINEEIVCEGLKATLAALKVPVEQFRSQFRLYRSILFDNKDEFWQNATVWNINQSWILTSETYLEICSRQKRILFIGPILQKLMDVDESWERAISKANASGVPNIAQMIQSRQRLMDNRAKASYNRLHIAVQDNSVEVIKYILDNNLVDPNRGEAMLGTPLCLALSLGHMDSVYVLRQYNIDVNKTNRFNQTPLHIALESKIMDNSLAFINAPDLVDHKDCYGFTSLHLAVINKDEERVNIFVERGANIIMPLQIQQTSHMDNIFKLAITPLVNVENPLTLSLKLHRTILPSMLAKISPQICSSLNSDEDSLLHLSAKLLVPSITGILIAKGSNVNIINKKKNTPLHSAFLESTDNCWEMEGFIETIQILVNNGANINQLNANELSAFHCAMDTNSRNTLNVILNQCQQVNVRVEDIDNLYQRQWPDLLKSVLDLQNIEFKRTMLKTYIIKSQMELIEFILEITGEKFIKSIVEDCLLTAAESGMDEIFERFLQYKIDSPQLIHNEETILTHLIKHFDEKYSLKLCKSEMNENLFEMKNQSSYTALHLAAAKGYLKVFKFLIMECQNLNEEHNGKTAVDMLMEQICNTNDKKKIQKVEAIMKMVIKQMIPKADNFIPSFISNCKHADLKAKLEVYYLKNSKVNPTNDNLDEDKNLCEICISDKIDCVFACGHPFCKTCAKKLEICPKCRQKKSKCIALYLP